MCTTSCEVVRLHAILRLCIVEVPATDIPIADVLTYREDILVCANASREVDNGNELLLVPVDSDVRPLELRAVCSKVNWTLYYCALDWRRFRSYVVGICTECESCSFSWDESHVKLLFLILCVAESLNSVVYALEVSCTSVCDAILLVCTLYEVCRLNVHICEGERHADSVVRHLLESNGSVAHCARSTVSEWIELVGILLLEGYGYLRLCRLCWLCPAERNNLNILICSVTHNSTLATTEVDSIERPQTAEYSREVFCCPRLGAVVRRICCSIDVLNKCRLTINLKTALLRNLDCYNLVSKLDISLRKVCETSIIALISTVEVVVLQNLSSLVVVE